MINTVRSFPNAFILALYCVFGFFSCKDTPKQNPETTPLVKEQVQVPVVIEPIQPDYDTTQWTDIHLLDSTIIIDLKYATTDNFVKEKLYDCQRCFLRPPAAKALVKAHQEFQQEGLRIKVLDCFRPRPIQQKLWDKVPNPNYVTPPKKGSMHNRGLAVDLTLVDQNNEELEMGTAFDYFGKEAHHTYTNLPEKVLNNRKLLKERLAKYHFRHIRTEWWHYSYTYGKFGLSDMLWNCES